MQILDKQDGLRQYAGPGHWNDPDMMEVGNMSSSNEDRAHFAMWAMLAAPLIAGNDIRSMTDATRAILTNREVIAVDQDPLGIPGFPYRKEDGLEIWFRPLEGDAWALAVLNRNSDARKVTFDWVREDVEDALHQRRTHFDKHVYKVRDLFMHTDAGSTAQALKTTVPGHGVVMYRLEKQR
jgi:alpha-galactosidase